MSIMASNDDPTPVQSGDRLLVGHDPATLLRVVDITERNGRQMARIEAGHHDRVRWQTSVAEVRDKLDRGRYRRVESR